MSNQSVSLRIHLLPDVDVNRLASVIGLIANAVNQVESKPIYDSAALEAEIRKAGELLNEADKEFANAFSSNPFDALGAAVDESTNKVKTRSKELADSFSKAFDELKGLDVSNLDKVQIAFSTLKDEQLDSDSLKSFNDQLQKALSDEAKALKTNKELLDSMKAMGKEGTDAYRNIEAEISKSEEALSKFVTETETGAKSAELFTKAFNFNQTLQSLQAVTGAFNNFVEPYKQFDQQLKNIGTLGVKNFEDFRNAAIDLASGVPDTVAGVTEGIYNAISAGAIQVVDGQADVANGMNFIEQASKLAVAGLTDTNAAIKGLASVTNAYGTDVLSAGNAADILFATVKNGVTTVPEMNAALSNVVPIAAAAGVSFEQVGGAIATLTKQGVPTAQATTQIRSAIAELMKPGANLKKVMTEAGVSLETLKADGLQETMRKLGGGMKIVGVDAANTFSSIESIGFALASTGENAAKAALDLESIKAGAGSVEEAFAIANSGIGVQVQGILNQVEAMAFKAFGALGDGAVVALDSINKLAPTVATFAGLGAIIPDGAIDKLKQFPSLVGKIPSSLNSALPSFQSFSGMIGSSLNNSRAFATSLISTLVPAFSSTALASTATASASATAWGAALAPITAVVAGVVGLGLAFKYAYDNIEGFRVFVDDLFGFISTSAEEAWSVISVGFDAMLSVFKTMGSIVTLPFQILFSVLGEIGNAIFGLGDNTDRTGSSFETMSKFVGIVADALKLTITIIKATADGLTGLVSTITDGVGGAVSKLLSGDLSGAVSSIANMGSEAGKGFSDGFDNSLSSSQVDVFAERLEKRLEAASEVTLKVKENESLDNMIQQYEGLQSQIGNLESIAPENLTESQQLELDTLRKKAEEVATQIGTAAKGAVTGTKSIIDETGNIKTVYDISIKKAREFQQAQADVYSNDAKKRQKEYSGGLMNLNKEYDNQKKKLEELNREAARLNASGDAKGAEKVNKQYIELNKTIEGTREKLVKAYTDGAKSGLLTKDAQDKVGASLGLSKNESKKLVENQKNMTDEAKETAEAVLTIGGAFDEAAKKANESYKNAFADANGALLELKKAQASGDKEAIKAAKLRYDETLKFAKQQFAEKKNLDNISEANKKLLEGEKKKSTTQESAFKQAQKRFETEKKTLQQGISEFEITQEHQRLLEKRQKTAYDDLLIETKKNEVLQKQREELNKQFQIKSDDKGNIIDIGVRLNSDEKKDEILATLNTQLKDLNNELAKSENKQLEIKSKIDLDEQKLQEELRKLSKSQLEFEIEMGLKPKSDLVKFYDEELAQLQSKIDEKVDAMNEVLKLDPEMNLDITKSQISLLEKERITLNNNKIGLEKSRKQQQKAIYAEDLKDFQTKADEELKIVENRLKLERELQAIILSSTEKVSETGINSNKDKKLRDLEEQKELELITEDEYNKLKERAEVEHQKQIEAIRAASRGAMLEAERQQTLYLLEEQQKRIQNEIDLRESQGATDEELKPLNDKLAKLQEDIKDKGDLIKAYSGELQASVTDIFSNLLGDSESMKEPWRKALGTLAGVLKQIASAAITNMVLGQLGLAGATTGLGALIAVPAIKGLVNSAVSALIDPIIGSLSSFATGGRVDSPTLAIIGDASKARPGADTEWILRDDQIKWIIQKSIGELGIDLDELTYKISANIDVSQFSKLDDLVNISVKQIDYLNENSLELHGLRYAVKSMSAQLERTNLSKSDLSVEDFMYMFENYTKENNIRKSYYEGKIDTHTYDIEMSKIQIKVPSYASGSGFVSTPRVAVIGDNPFEPEIVNRRSDLFDIANRSASVVANEMVSVLREELAKTRESIDNLELNITEREIYNANVRVVSSIEKRKRG
jgi:TP901 family phage tail tape measure protein